MRGCTAKAGLDGIHMKQWKMRWMGLWLAAMSAWLAIPVRADDPAGKYRIQLVWGTDVQRPAGKDAMKPLDPATSARLRQLRWTNYFVTKTEFATPDSKEHRRVTLSDRCAVDLKEVEGGKLEVRMLSLKPGSEPKQVASRAVGLEALKKGEMMIYAGDSKDRWDDCWLVIVDEPAAKPAAAGKP